MSVEKLREWINSEYTSTVGSTRVAYINMSTVPDILTDGLRVLLALADVMDGAKELDLDHDCYCELGFECAPCTAESDFRRALTGANEKIAELPPKG